VVRDWQIPKPVVLVDTREQAPLPLRENHPNWIGDERRATLKTGDYSVEGMEKLLALERKSMSDVIASTMVDRARFIRGCARLAKYRWKAILIEATYEDMKTPYYRFEGLCTEAHPNAVCGTLDAIEAKLAAAPTARDSIPRRNVQRCGTRPTLSKRRNRLASKPARGRFGIPVLYTSRDRDLAVEKAASWLSKHFTYWWLEKNGHGRVLIDSDGL
jgi:ERCC4-type nuclease